MKFRYISLFILFFSLVFSKASLTAQVPELILPIGHSGALLDASFSPDGKRIATASDDRTVKIWNTENGRLLLTIDGFTNMSKVRTVIFSPDGKSIMTTSDDLFVRIWDPNNGKLLHKFINIGEPGGDINVRYSPDGKYVLQIQDTIINMLNIQNGELIRTSQLTHVSDIGTGDQLFTINTTDSRPVYSPDSSKILTVSDLNYLNGKWKKISYSFDVDSDGIEGRVVVSYDAMNGRLINTYIDSTTIDTLNYSVGTHDPFYFIGYSPNGKNIIAISDKFRIWDTETRKLLFRIEGQFSKSTSFYFSPDSKRILLISDTFAALYDATNGRQLHTYDKPKFRVYGMLSENERWVPTAGISPNHKTFFIIPRNSNSLKLWDLQSGDLKLDLNGHTTGVNRAFFSADGNYVLSGSFNKRATSKVWDLNSGKILQSLEGQELNSACYEDEGMLVHTAAKAANGKVAINTWHALTGKLLNVIELQDDTITKFVFSPDGTTLVVIDTINVAKILDAKTGIVLHKLDRPVGDIKYNPDGKSILTTSWVNFAELWDIGSGRLIHSLRDQEASAEGSIRTLRISTFNNSGELIEKDTAICQGIIKAEFSSDGENLINASDNWDEVTRIWNTKTGSLLKRFKGFKGAINNDGTKVLTLVYPDSVTYNFGMTPDIWDVSTGNLLYNLEDFEPGIASFSFDGKKILTAAEYGDSVKIWDAQNGQLERAIHFSGTLRDIDWKDNRLIIHDNSKLVFYDIRTGKELYSIIAIDSADYLTLTPDKYYMCSKNAASKLSWRVGDELYSFDQFDLQYNRPDIVLERLGNPDTALIKMYRNAYLKRLKKAGLSENMFTPEWHTPEIEILNSDSLYNTINKSSLQLKICGKDSRYNLNRLLVWVNGVPMYGSNGLSLLEEKTDSIVKTISINLSTGDNNIKVSCMNEKGVESLKESVDIVYDPPKPVSTDLYIIAMSVSDYKDNRYDLHYAAKDGRDIADLFKSLAILKGDYRHIIIDTLFNSKATKKNFFKLKNKLLTTNVEDQVIVFVSGHGLLNKEMDFYFATYDIDFRNPEKKGISFDDLESILDGISARKKLLMMDACHSGEVDKEEITDLVAANTVSSSDITFRGSVREYNFKGVDNRNPQTGMSLNNSFELMQELFAGLDQGTGTTVISAAAGKGYALESPQWNNGVFTYSIINGLENRAADKNKDSIVTISELKDYSIKQVQLLTGGKQKPTVRRESINYDWRIR